MQPRPGCRCCRGMNACGIGMDVPLEGRGDTATPGPGREQELTGRGDGWSEAVFLGCWAKATGAVRLRDGECWHCPALPRNGLYFFLSCWAPGTAILLPDESSYTLMKQELLPLQVTLCSELLGNIGVSVRKFPFSQAPQKYSQNCSKTSPRHKQATESQVPMGIHHQ